MKLVFKTSVVDPQFFEVDQDLGKIISPLLLGHNFQRKRPQIKLSTKKYVSDFFILHSLCEKPETECNTQLRAHRG